MRGFLTLLLLLACSVPVFAQPSNDDCGFAIELPRQVAITCNSSYSATTVAATASSQAAVFAANKDDDVWFQVSLASGQTEANINVSDISFTGAPVDLVFELWSFDCNTYQSKSYLGGTAGNFTWNMTGLTASGYKIRVYTNNTTSRVNFKICYTAGPENDNCEGAIMIPVQSGSCIIAQQGSTIASTASPQTAYIPFAANDDVWYHFTTPAGGVAGAVKVALQISDVDYGADVPKQIHLELREGTAALCNNSYANSTTLSPNGGTWLLTNLNPSTDYSIRLYSDDAPSRITSFGICAFTPVPPANDDCASATTIAIASNTGFEVQTAGTIGATASSQTSGDAAGKDDDVWFSFTTPASSLSAQVVISDHTFTSGFGQVAMELWTACGAAAFSSWTSGSLSWTTAALAPSTTYKLRLYTYGTSTRLSAFKVTLNLLPPAPGNDLYANATTLPLTPGASCNAALTGQTTVGANEEPGFTVCGGATQHKDVWYKFVATKATAYIQLSNVVLAGGTSSTLVMDVFEGSNTGPLKLCSNTGVLDFNASTAGATLNIGTTYYMRVYNQDALSSSTFDFCTKISTGLTFSDCSKAINIPVSSDEFCSNAVQVTNLDANKGTLVSGCTPDQWNSVWVKFVAPANPGNYQFSIQNYKVLIGSNPTFYVAMYSGTCGSLTQINCNIGGLQDIPSTLTPGQTYLVNILTASASSQGTFDICIRKQPNAPTNTSCASAQTLTATSDASAAYVAGTTQGVTMASATDCFGFNSPNRIVWYKFVATATSHLVDVTNFVQLSSNSNSAGIRVKQGTCAALSDLAAPVCVFGIANSNQVITGLTPGNTYFIEMMENTFNGGPVSYKIRVIGTAAPTNDESAGAITLAQSPTCDATTNYTLRFSTLSTGVTDPFGTFSQDVWFKFTAVATSATVTTTTRLAPNPLISLYAANASTLINDGNYGSVTFTGLTIGNVYYLRILNAGSATPNPNEDFTICVTGMPASAIASDPTPGPCVANDNAVVSTNSGNWLHFTKSGNIIASVLDIPGGAGMGVMTAKYFINTAAVRADGDGEEYLDRNIDIAPTTQPTNPVKVRLYFSRAEFERLVGANDGDGNDVYWLNDLKISKFSNLLCQSVIGSTGELLYSVSGYGLFGANAYYLDVIIPSFSSFYVLNTTGVLPVNCGGFNYERKNASVRLAWKTLTELNAAHFEIQRSFNGTEFHKLATIAASGIPSSYNYVDASAGDGIVYYRLLAVDKDGNSRFTCSTLKVSAAGVRQPVFGNVFPNPVNNEINVKMNRSYNGNVGLQVIDATGHIILSRSVMVTPADVKISMAAMNLPKGVYVLRMQTTEGVETIKFTK